MSKKIFILNGSPRDNGNTKELIRAFTKGAESAGNEVTCFNLYDMEIRPCRGCGKGGEEVEAPCIQLDDMLKIYPYYRHNDVIVLATPVYFWGINGLLKCAIDRLYAIFELARKTGGEVPKKDSVLLVAAGGNTEDNFDGTRVYYESLCKNMGWNRLGEIYAGGNLAAGDILKHTEQLKEAEKLGMSIR